MNVMDLKNRFIKATDEYNTFEKSVAAPYIRKSFISDTETTAKVRVAACGFYELYLNGIKYTRGFLAPYISNPEHYIYYNEYEISIDKGENVIGLILGNGIQNNPGGYIWNLDKASFRSAPMAAVCLTYKNSLGEEVSIESDRSFKTAPSHIISDEYRFGEVCDANFEIVGWNDKGFDDSAWANVIETVAPSGELRICEATPIVKEKEIKPLQIWQDGDGYIYDFGECNAGVCRLEIIGKKGQKIEMQHSDFVKDGKLRMDYVWFVRDYWERDKEIFQKDVYICKGEGKETYSPTFTYHGFRYVRVTGITPEQATEDLLTYIVIHSAVESRGDFHCSDDVVNKIQEITRRSDVSNYHYFPTDCPQREKHGWTGDAALSCEQMLLNFNPEVNYREWLRNICKAQKENGGIPGVVPIAGWGSDVDYGPGFDRVLVYLPYFVYIYRGEKEMIKESAAAMTKYMQHIASCIDDNGLTHNGLGDWVHVGRGMSKAKAPYEVVSSAMAMDAANKAAFLFDVVGMEDERDFARSIAEGLKSAMRKNLIDYDTMIAEGNCQTSQAMFLHYGVFTEEETRKAADRLVDMVHSEDDHMDVGAFGGRVLFHVLTEYGYSDLAYKMITRPDFPSYGNLVKRGATTLWEMFFPEESENWFSMNHHFWGDISAWFIKCLAGIRLNPNGNNIHYAQIKPSFVTALDNAGGYHIAPDGKIVSSWQRSGDKIILNVEVPKGMTAAVIAEKGFSFEDGEISKEITSGKYTYNLVPR